MTTQLRTAPRLLSPARRTEYRRLAFLRLGVDGLTAIGDAVKALGAELLRNDPTITELLTTFADSAPPATTGGRDPADLIAGYARLHGLLDLAWTTDAATVRDQVQAAGPDALEVMLDEPGDAAYRRLAPRFAGMWGARLHGLDRTDG
jgi:hypothetical protein